MKKISVTTIVLIIIMIAGLSLVLYPSLAEYVNKKHQTTAIASYVEQVENADEIELEKLLEDAHEYNRSLVYNADEYTLSDEMFETYNKMLRVGDSDIIGQIDIPKIDVTLPIYHNTDNSVLSVGVGHLEWTSLPVGGESTHSVLVGHRGLPSSRLFTDLDMLEAGDTFTLRILNEVLTYEVDQILIVEPDEVDELKIVDGEDYCTLLTCTPYGINTHRILVRGKRIDTVYEVLVTSEAIEINSLITAAILAVPLLILFMIILSIHDRRSQRDEERRLENEKKYGRYR